MFKTGWIGSLIRFFIICGIVVGLMLAALVFGISKAWPHNRPDLAPRIVEVSPERMKVMLCGAEPNCDGPVALYTSGTIYIRPGLDLGDPRTMGMILHEFVHHLQHLSGLEQTLCRGERERQAYEVQRAWLDQNGLKPDSEVDFPGPLKLMMIERCEGL